MTNDSEQVEKLVAIKTRRLRILEVQKAIYGIVAPPQIELEIQDLRKELEELGGKPEDRGRIEDLIELKTRRLYLLEERQAVFGTACPPEIIMEIEDLRSEIVQLKRGVTLSDIPVRRSAESAQQNSVKRSHIFISYSHNDMKWLQRLQIHIKPLEKLGTITRWDDTLIDPGQKWREEIKKAIDVTKVAVLLVSADFLASDFIIDNELPPLLAAAETEGAAILSVIVSPCRFMQTENLSQFQAVNSPSQPLNLMSKGRQEAILVKVSEAIEKALRL
jgi:hypothetical protein